MPITNIHLEKATEALETGTMIIPSHVAFGTGDTAFSADDTTLDTETVRNAVTSTNRSGNTMEWIATLTESQGNGTTIKEVGLFNASSSGTMSVRDVIFDVDKTSSFEYDAIFVIRNQ